MGQKAGVNPAPTLLGHEWAWDAAARFIPALRYAMIGRSIIIQFHAITSPICILLSIQTRLFRPLLGFLLLHPADKEHASNDDVGEIGRNPHNQPTQLLVCHG